jgi:hypothetical protein
MKGRTLSAGKKLLDTAVLCPDSIMPQATYWILSHE